MLNGALFCLVAGLAAAAFAAPRPATARDHYFSAARADRPEWIGVRTGFLVKRGEGGALDVLDAGEDFDFVSNDRFKIRIQSNTGGYLYVLFQTGSGYKLLFPDANASGAGYEVKPFEERLIPANGRDWFRMDRNTGLEQALVVLSARPVDTLEAARVENRIFTAEQLERLVAGNGPARSMRFDEAEAADGAIAATYYVEKRRAGSTLIRRLEIVHNRRAQ